MNQTVAEVMTANPICVAPSTPLKDAVHLLAEHRIGGLPVLDDGGRLVGMLSESDLMQRESGITPPPFVMFLDLAIFLKTPQAFDKELHKVFGETVGEVMGKPTQSVPMGYPLPQAAHLLAGQNIQSLLVVDDEQHLQGIVTRGDVVRAMAVETVKS